MAKASNESAGLGGFFEKHFRLRENKTNVRTEVVAGITTFMTMAYIIVVNPGILATIFEGTPEYQTMFTAFMIATIASAILSTVLMAFLGNYPFALAPGMGLNAYFTYTVVFQMGYAWEVALGAVFISGILFVLLSISGIREAIINAIPAGLKSGISAGIGLFIAFVGLQNAGLVISDPATMVAIGSLREPAVMLAMIGIILTGILLARKVRGAILIGIFATALVGIPMGVTPIPDAIVSIPRFSAWAPVFGKLDIRGALGVGLIEIVFAFLFVDLFDTIGTLVGVSERAGYLDKDGKLPRAEKALLADSIGTIGGAVMGTSTVTTFVESASGVAVGGRTGLTALVTAGCFFLALFFGPVISIIPNAATAPALIVVGAMMAQGVLNIKWADMDEALPAFIAMIAMPLTYSIATGIALGFIVYPLVKAFSGKTKEVHWIMWVLAALFILRFLYLA